MTGIRRLAPVVDGNRQQVKYFDKNASVNITGTSPTYLPIRDFEVEKGRCFTEAEIEGRARVCVLGPQTAENLFGEDDPLGADHQDQVDQLPRHRRPQGQGRPGLVQPG